MNMLSKHALLKIIVAEWSKVLVWLRVQIQLGTYMYTNIHRIFVGMQN